jgi:hypothetical protein
VLPIEDIVKHPDYFGGKSKARDQQGSTQLRGLFIRPEYDGRKLKTRDEDANAPAYLVKRPDYVGGKHKARGLEELAKRPEYAGGKRDDGVINAHRSERLGKRPTYDGGKRNGITTGERAEDIVKRPVYSGGKRWARDVEKSVGDTVLVKRPTAIEYGTEDPDVTAIEYAWCYWRLRLLLFLMLNLSVIFLDSANSESDYYFSEEFIYDRQLSLNSFKF